MNETLLKILFIFGIVFSTVSIGLLIIKKILLGIVDKWARKTSTELDDIIIESIRYPAFFWTFALAFYIAIGTSKTSPRSSLITRLRQSTS